MNRVKEWSLLGFKIIPCTGGDLLQFEDPLHYCRETSFFTVKLLRNMKRREKLAHAQVEFF